jgi:hypothetical protein
MEEFKILRIFSVVFKVVAWIMLVLMAVGLFGFFVTYARSGQQQMGWELVFNMLFGGVTAFLVFYAFSETIRLLLAIHDRLSQQG